MSSSIDDRTNQVNEVIKGGPVVMTLAREVHGDAYLPAGLCKFMQFPGWFLMWIAIADGFDG